MNARRGFTLIEILVYVLVFSLVIVAVYPATVAALRHSGALRRNADDILRSLRVGEQWRQDIRAADAPPRATGQGFEIPRTDGVITYAFGEGAVWRSVNGNPPQRVLTDVEISTMRMSSRADVPVAEWTIELVSPRSNPILPPRFGFLAVPGGRTP